MRRSVAEWLLLPLFVLPLAAGALLCLWFERDLASEIEGIRRDGAGYATALLGDEDGAAWMVSRFLSDFRPGGPLRPVGVRFDDGDGGGEAAVPHDALGAAPWTFAAEFPQGIAAPALADREVRMGVEGGKPPPDRALGAGGREFRDLAAAPDLDRLRVAPLPAATKLYLLRRWLREDPDSPALLQATGLVRAVRDLHRAREEGGALGPGDHRIGATEVLASGGLWPPVLLPAGGIPASMTHGAGAPRARLTWRTGAPHGGGTVGRPVVWAGRLEAPLAGEFVVALNRGGSLWRDPAFLRWAGPAGGGILAFLLIPGALLVSIRKRRRLDEARARFINELAHDLRTPLTSLRLYAEMLAEGRVGPSDLDRYAGVMARESARLSGLLANLLDLSRLEHGKRVFEREEIDLDEAVSGAVRDFAAIHADRADDIRVRGEDDLHVTADRTALARCLANLLDNAGKYTAPGTEIAISWERAGEGRVRIAVADRGPGVPPDERRALFRRYARGSGAKADGVPGTGLGLSLVAELAEGVGGAARFVETEVGATFEILLLGGTHDRG